MALVVYGLLFLDAEALIRCMPGEDHTNGFFVSCFIRKANKFDTSSGQNVTIPQESRKRPAVQDDEVADETRAGGTDVTALTKKTTDQTGFVSGKRKNKKKRLKK